MEVVIHEYANVNEKKDAAEIDYVNIDIAWGQQPHYEILNKLGRGKYSLVFEGINVTNKQKVAIKVLKPIRKEKIKREYFMLSNLVHPNLVKMVDAVRDPLTKTASFILEFAATEDYRLAFPKFSYMDIKFYMKELFKVLDYLHSNGVMHRDIKPQNILFDRHQRTFKLIDFSLAELYYPEKEYSTRVSSLYYKAPELLLGNVFYDYRVDIWAAGVILAGLIFKSTPFFQGSDELDQLARISKIVGAREIAAYCKENAHQLLERKDMRKQIIENYNELEIKKLPKVNLLQLVNKNNEDFVSEDALNLVGKLLTLNPKQRITARQALEHPFFSN